jgi:hypothetical protein
MSGFSGCRMEQRAAAEILDADIVMMQNDCLVSPLGQL